LKKSIDKHDLPDYLGGEQTGLRTVESVAPSPLLRYSDEVHSDDGLTTISVHARHRKVVPVHVTADGTDDDSKTAAGGGALSWYFRSDGDFWFGVFRLPNKMENVSKHQLEAKLNVDTLEMAFPWLRVGAKVMPEYGHIENVPIGMYVFVFCNQKSWLTKRHVHIKISTNAGSVDIE
jgi:hypothetical protein